MKQDLLSLVNKLCKNVSQVFLGKEDVVKKTVVAMLAGEHVLLEDVPGVGKTLLGKAVAKSVSGRFDRIQFTPDLLPSDITGSSIFNAKTQEFTFESGPVFTNILLADEINRTTPRTQSALLEAMAEHQVSADGQTYPLPKPFMVIATQNPLEFEGTYPLPESQLDRFLMRISIGYPDQQNELALLVSHREGEPVDSLESVLSCDQVVELQEATRQIRVDETINQYILDIVHATRENDDLHVGVSTRGTLALYRAAQATAVLAGRDYVVPDDVKQLVVPVLSHRVVTKGYLHGGQREAVEALIERLVDEIDAP
ncbi:MAG: MoxR family ATPase [Planctomycetia bacterium]|jgi:MoxR-like ATPase